MRLTILFLLLFAWACAQQEQPAPPKDHILVLPGLTVTAPSAPAWKLTRADRSQASLENPEDQASLVARVFTSNSFSDDQEFLKFAEARQEEAVSPLQMLSVHYESKKIRDANCLQYDGVFRDPLAADSESEFLNLEGYLCRHPSSATQVVQLELTRRSATRNPENLESTLAVAETFFASAVFTSDAPDP